MNQLSARRTWFPENAICVEIFLLVFRVFLEIILILACIAYMSWRLRDNSQSIESRDASTAEGSRNQAIDVYAEDEQDQSTDELLSSDEKDV